MENPTSLVVLSGEHPTLPLAEVRGILSAHKIDFNINQVSYKIVELDVQPDALRKISERGAFIDKTLIEIFHSSPSVQDVTKGLRSVDLSPYLGPEDNFSVRVSRFGGVHGELARPKLESYLGGLLATSTGARVNLSNPAKHFHGILTGSLFYFGLVGYERPAGMVHARRPKRRAVFHPSTMMPKLARCMVNLSGIVDGSIFLDPFCGVGGILVEASLLGCQVVAIDAVKRMVRGSRRNLSHFGLSSIGFVRGDARKIPLNRVEAIATDPPYGTGASTLKSTTKNILTEFLPEAHSILPVGRKIVIASPKGTQTMDLAENAGFKITGRHEVYVHRRLTREILVLESD
ncbi:MAG TPA: methyltransferase domain-containing protein [Candidatus Bathyarchaeia archaeon]|nr:methyltransferase domain-containing protein [Candidatus Bathyarchaeia archaeon]